MGRRQNSSPRRQASLVSPKASKRRRLNVFPEARTSKIPCRPNAGTKSAVDKRIVSGLSPGGCRPVDRRLFVPVNPFHASHIRKFVFLNPFHARNVRESYVNRTKEHDECRTRGVGQKTFRFDSQDTEDNRPRPSQTFPRKRKHIIFHGNRIVESKTRIYHGLVGAGRRTVERGGKAETGRTGHRRDGSPRIQPSPPPSRLLKKTPSGMILGARTIEIPCKPTGNQNRG